MRELQNRWIALVVIMIGGILMADTISGQDTIVQIPRIKNICVNTDNVYLEWEQSTTPGVNYYTIYYKYIGLNPNPDWKELQGIQIPASSPPNFLFSPSLIAEVDVTSEPVAFAVQAHTDTVESLVDDRFWELKWDSTIYLQGSYNTCLASIELTWNPYDFNMWNFNTQEYRIYTSENGADPILNTTVSSNQTSVIITNLIANNDYDIFIAAIPANGKTSDSATSTTLKINTDMPVLPGYIHADFATWNDDNVDLQFNIDPVGELENYKLLRSNTFNGTYDTVIEVETDEHVLFLTDKVDYNAGPYYYKLVAINHCDVAIRESQNVASSILLSSSGDEVSPVLNWTNYENWINGISEYSLERQIGDNDFEVIYQSSATNYTDDDLESQQGSGMRASVCYRVTALENNNIYGQNATSLSNTVCVELPVNIRFEYDAFTPGNSLGNNSFGPTIDYVPDYFQFKILDRSGRVVFETQDAGNSRWNGRYQGQLVPQGAYMYVLQYHMKGGKKHTLRGGVVVVYPE